MAESSKFQAVATGRPCAAVDIQPLWRGTKNVNDAKRLPRYLALPDFMVEIRVIARV